MSTKRKKKGRKRKQPDTFNDDIPSQPRSKKRKLSITHNKRTKTTNDKSQSTSPKISKSSPNPYKNTTIPTLTFNNNKSKLSRRSTTYSNDDSTDDEDNLSSPESSENHYNTKLLKYNTIRSQPSTPIHKIKSNNDKKDKEPHSQSAKRSKTTKKFYIKPSNNIHTNTYPYDSSLSPPPALGNNTDRKAMRLLLESQESLPFSPPRNKPKMRSMNVQITHNTPKRNINHVIPVNATPLRTQYGNNNTLQMDNMNGNRSNMQMENDNNITNTHRHTYRHIHSHGETQTRHNSNQPPDKPVANKYNKWWNNDIIKIILFVLFGFICGIGVSVAVNRQHVYPKATTIYNRYNIIDTDQCTCDIDSNSTSRLCSPCMDQYWNLKSECDGNNNIKLKKERDELILEKEKLKNELKKKSDDVNVDGCILRLNHLENEMNECKNMKNDLKIQIEKLQNKNEINCDEYEDKIGELEHELGECNVEWGSCEQLGRQKDKLDEKRLEEIQKQKHKFSLCNEQLKRYKEAAKKNKGR